MTLADLDLGPLRHVFEADRIAVFEQGELHAVDEPGDEVRPAPTWSISWRADTQEWRDTSMPGVVYLAPAALWRRLVLEAKEHPDAAVEAGEAMHTPASDRDTPPVKGWAAVAGVLGVSPWTVRRRRVARGDHRHPYFASADEARAWWAGLVAGPPPKSRRSRGGRRRRDTVADDEFTLANLEAGKLK